MFDAFHAYGRSHIRFHCCGYCNPYSTPYLYINSNAGAYPHFVGTYTDVNFHANSHRKPNAISDAYHNTHG